MRHEFFYKYVSPTGIPSECHFRVLADRNRPVVVICSQVFGYDGHPLGRSICNAFEGLHDSILKWLRKEAIASELNEIKVCFQNGRNALCAAVAAICHLLPRVNSLLRVLRLRSEDRQFVWVEHWPSCYDCAGGTGFWRVCIDSKHRPAWSQIDDLNDFALGIGYSMEDIQKLASSSEGGAYAEI